MDVYTAVLSKEYGLTRGEAELAALLSLGKSIDEAAAALSISPHSARTHLKRILMKTDTRGRRTSLPRPAKSPERQVQAPVAKRVQQPELRMQACAAV